MAVRLDTIKSHIFEGNSAGALSIFMSGSDSDMKGSRGTIESLGDRVAY